MDGQAAPVPQKRIGPLCSIPCPPSHRHDTTGVSVSPPRRSVPAISRFCLTLGWLNLVKSVTHRAAVSVALVAPIAFNVPDMWSRYEDNLLEQTISNMIPLDVYHPFFLTKLRIFLLQPDSDSRKNPYSQERRRRDGKGFFLPWDTFWN